MSCHGTGHDEALPQRSWTTVTRVPRVVLVGNPNVGKSTLFNALTGARQRTMNAPGTTVHWETGRWRTGGTIPEIELVDLPGAQSLLAISPDEQVTADALIHDDRPDLAIVVMDATALARSLYLLAQVRQVGVPVVAAVTMNDVACVRGLDVERQRLTDRLGIPVVYVDPRARLGLEPLAQAVRETLALPVPEPAPSTDPVAFAAALRENSPQHFEWVAQVERDLSRHVEHRETWSDRIDRVLLNPWAGVPVFFAVMWAVFQLTTTVAAPMQDWIDGLLSGTVGGWLASGFEAMGLGGSWVESLTVDGLLAGVATVATFIPPMGIMFLALSILEDSGYMARAGFVADRLMRVMGLDGRAFLPLVIGFGCNLPALAATRTLPNSRQRLLTGLLIPLSSCTARLVVYVLIANVFFRGNAGTAVFLMYVASVVLIIAGGLLLRRTAFRDLKSEPFVLNLPAYQAPRLRPMATSVLLRLRDFVVKAGRVIMVMLVLMWALISIPVGSGTFGHVDVEDSLYGATAHAVAPVFAPAGFDDWHTSAALVTGFVAKEVVVGALAQSYAVSEPSNPADPGKLSDELRATLDRASGGHGAAAAAAFMVFVLAYTPCAATVAEQRRHFGWRPAAAGVGVSLLVAWVLAVAVFQIGRLL